jgi:hypothetical protein
MGRAAAAVLLACLAAGCGGGPPPADEPPPPPADAGQTVSVEILERPYTTEQIRDEWSEGFQLTLRRRTHAQEIVERWTVVAADEEGVEIEHVTLDQAGQPSSEPRVERSRWSELRDHATFPSSTSRRERVRRATPLGDLEGWLYVKHDAALGTTSEYFFADGLPGAPVSLLVTRGDERIVELTQIERRRPG